MFNQKILESLLNIIKIETIIEFDKDLDKYTAYNEIVPQIYGEGNTKDDAINQMVVEAKLFAEDYVENIELFSSILDGVQQFIVSNILLNLENDNKLRKILKIA
jgi:hypothetical protein